MSLVNDALKKARLDAAREAVGERGIPYPMLRRTPKADHRQWLLAALAVAIVILVGYWLFRFGAATAEKDAPQDAVASSEAQPAKTAGEDPGPPPETPEGLNPRAQAEPVHQEPVVEASTVVTAPEPPPAKPEARVVEADGEFVGEATIADQGTISLGGIAWSGDRPFALINGKVVAPGDSISGFTDVIVSEIMPDSVAVRVDSRTLVLRLK